MAILSYFNEYDGADYYDPYAAYYGLLTPEATYPYAAPTVEPYMAPAATQVPQVQAAPTLEPVPPTVSGIENSNPAQESGDPFQVPSWVTDPAQLERAAIIRRLAAGEQIPGWEWFPEQTRYIAGDSEITELVPASAFYQGQEYTPAGFAVQNQSLGDVIKEAAPLAAVMGTAYLGGTALAGAGGGTAAGTAAAAAPVTDAATAAFLEANMGTLAPTVSSGFAPITQVGLAELGAVGLPAAEIGLPSLLAPEVIAPTVLPEVAGSGLLASAMQTIPVTGAKLTAAAPWWAPVATAATALPIINSLTSPSAPAPSDAPYSNEGRTPSEPRGNMGGEGTPEVPTVNVEPTPWDQFKAWATANPEMARMAFSAAGGLLSASGGSSGGSGGYRDSGYRPTVSRGGWQPSVTQRTMPTTPLSLNLPTTGQPNSGLWRYGLLGG